MNPIKEKKLTNIRAAGKDDAMLLIPPRRMSLEQAIAYIEDDELVEVTPARSGCASATSIRTSASGTSGRSTRTRRRSGWSAPVGGIPWRRPHSFLPILRRRPTINESRRGRYRVVPSPPGLTRGSVFQHPRLSPGRPGDNQPWEAQPTYCWTLPWRSCADHSEIRRLRCRRGLRSPGRRPVQPNSFRRARTDVSLFGPHVF